MKHTPPKIENAPGLTWRRRKAHWEARWQCRTDLSVRGYEIKSQRLWAGVEPNETDVAYIQSQCEVLQSAMLIWGRGGVPQVMTFDGTVRGLIYAYQQDKDSTYRKLEYKTRVHYDVLCRCLDKDIGGWIVADISARNLLGWHGKFVEAGHIPMGHACVGMLRTILTFGSTILADKTCREVRLLLHDMKFPMGRARNSILTAEHVNLIRAEARRRGKGSIALAQAFQFEFMLRQKDVIGDWVPLSEPAPPTETIWGNAKWIKGIRWEEISASMMLKHITSKRKKEINVDLRNAPMVMEELDLAFPGWNGNRANLPAKGPIIIDEKVSVPWFSQEFRRHWRFIATACGIPTTIKNMDSRAGAITEALGSGALMEDVRKSATHSDSKMTQRYSRGDADSAAEVAKLRAASRNKSGT